MPRQLLTQLMEYSEKLNSSEGLDPDAFWIVTDVDRNWSDEQATPLSPRSCREEWNEVVRKCAKKEVHLAVSNPKFEAWLLMHHRDIQSRDEMEAVTAQRPYKASSYFAEELKKVGAPLRKKRIREEHYPIEKVQDAVSRAKTMHPDPENVEPTGCGSTVYRLIEQIMTLSDAISE